MASICINCWSIFSRSFLSNSSMILFVLPLIPQLAPHHDSLQRTSGAFYKVLYFEFHALKRHGFIHSSLSCLYLYLNSLRHKHFLYRIKQDDRVIQWQFPRLQGVLDYEVDNLGKLQLFFQGQTLSKPLAVLLACPLEGSQLPLVGGGYVVKRSCCKPVLGYHLLAYGDRFPDVRVLGHRKCGILLRNVTLLCGCLYEILFLLYFFF